MQNSCWCHQDGSSFSNTNQISVQEYQIRLYPDLAKRNLYSEVKYRFTCLSDTKIFALDTLDIDIRSIQFNGKPVKYTFSQKNQELGSRLNILFEESLKQATQYQLQIKSFTDKSKSLTWGDFVFTQNEPIYCRSLFPCQDTPSRKSLFKTEVILPQNQKKYKSYVTGILKNNIYEMEIPIPTYLFAFIIGGFQKKQISDRIGIVALPQFMESYQKQLEAMQAYLQQLQKITFPYQWKQYNLVILPMSFPYGGMQNPIYTFASPSIITGDKSGTSVVIHQMAHSWTGNLVSCRNWENFWLNEGFTVFLQSKAQRRLYGEEYYNINSIMERSRLFNQIKNIGLQHSYSSLYPVLNHDNPDNAFSCVPYVKGYIFLTYLERLVGEQTFQLIFRGFLKKYVRQSVDYENFKNFFQNYVKQQKLQLSQVIQWENWIRTAGQPLKSDFWKSQKYDYIKNLIKIFVNGNYEEFKPQFKNLLENKSQLNIKLLELFFIDLLQAQITLESVEFLQKQFNLSNILFNFELLADWFSICLKVKNHQIIPIINQKILLKIGRMKFINKMYGRIAQVDKALSIELFNKNNHLYSEIANSFIKRILGIN